MSEHPPDIDLGAAHLRPGQARGRPPAAEPPAAGPDRMPWEGRRRRGLAAAFIATWWRFVRAPVAAFAAVPRAGGPRRPGTFALLCGAVFGVVSELIDSATVALLHYGRDESVAQAFQLDIAGRSLDWLPAAGCLVALLVGAPLFVLIYSLLVLAWTTIVHGLLRLAGGLAASEAGYQGTLRAVCYSQAAMVAAIVPWIGDPVAAIWSFCLQVPGLERMHGCSRGRAALAVGLPAGLLILALVLLVLFGEPQAAG